MIKKKNDDIEVKVCQSDDINLFYDVMLNGRKIKDEHEKEEIEASIYAIHLLIPDASIHRFIRHFGMEKCLEPQTISLLSKLFMVDERLMLIRLKLICTKIQEFNDMYSVIDSKKTPDYEESNPGKIKQKSKE